MHYFVIDFWPTMFANLIQWKIKTKTNQTYLELMTVISQSDVWDKSGPKAHNNNNKLTPMMTHFFCNGLCNTATTPSYEVVFLNCSILDTNYKILADLQELEKTEFFQSDSLSQHTVTSTHTSPCLSSSKPWFATTATGSVGPEDEQTRRDANNSIAC